MHIHCPKCSWSPMPDSQWNCEYCGHASQLFDNAGECIQCGFMHEQIYCIEWEGGCGESSPLLDWFSGIDERLDELNIRRLPD